MSSLAESLGFALFIPILSTDTSANEGSAKIRFFIDQIHEILGLESSLQSALFLMLLTFFFRGLLKFSEVTLRTFLTAKLSFHIRTTVFNSYSQMRYDSFLGIAKGSLGATLTTETAQSIAAITHFLISLASIASGAVFFILALGANAHLTLIGVCIVVSFYFKTKFLGLKSAQRSSLNAKTNVQIMSLLQQTLSSYKYLKSTNRFSIVKSHIFDLIGDMYKNHKKIGLFEGTLNGLQQPISAGALIALIYYSAVIQKLPIQETLVSLVIIYRIFTNLMAAQIQYQYFSGMRGGLDSVISHIKLFEEKTENLSNNTTISFQDAVALKNVSTTVNERTILKNISLSIPKNKVTGLIGRSGSGKSTIIDTITGLLTATSGQVFIDNVLLDRTNITSWRNQIGFVSQDLTIFSDSILNNISLWDQNSTSNIEELLKTVDLYGFICSLPDGLETKLGDGGIQLSGGQRQRLAIARELYKKPSLLILDEATAALDHQTELNVRSELEKIKDSTTLFIISHNPETIRMCDYIYIVDSGLIVEEGETSGLLNNTSSLIHTVLGNQKHRP